MAYGFIEGVFVGNEKFPALNEELFRLAEKYSVAPATIAIAWILRHPATMQANGVKGIISLPDSKDGQSLAGVDGVHECSDS